MVTQTIGYVILAAVISAFGHQTRAGDCPSADKLIEALQERDPGIREEAARCLYIVVDTRAVEPLIHALADVSIVVRARAADALGALRDRRAVPSLIEMLKGDIVSKAAEALATIQDVRAVPPLIDALKRELGGSPAADIQKALAEFKSPAALQAVAQAVTDVRNSEEVRMAVAYPLTVVDSQTSRSTLGALLSEKHLEFVARFHRYYIRLGRAGSEAVLVKALESYGNNLVAEDYANCGNAFLEKAAAKWASAHGYSIVKSKDARGGPAWGTMR